MWVKTGMSFKCTPEKTVAFKGDQCSGGKKVKRVTQLVGARREFELLGQFTVNFLSSPFNFKLSFMNY